jgi:hypothetical protein
VSDACRGWQRGVGGSKWHVRPQRGRVGWGSAWGWGGGGVWGGGWGGGAAHVVSSEWHMRQTVCMHACVCACVRACVCVCHIQAQPRAVSTLCAPYTMVPCLTQSVSRPSLLLSRSCSRCQQLPRAFCHYQLPPFGTPSGSQVN